MADIMIEKLARVLVRYSLGVKKGDWVRIEGNSLADDALRAAMAEVLNAGGHPTLRVGIDGTQRLMLEHGSPTQLRFVSPAAKLELEKVDCWLSFWGGWNTREMSGVDPKRMAFYRAARKPLFDRMLKRISNGSMRWTGTQYPTQSAAQDAEMALDEYRGFVFRAGLLHKKDPVAEWKKVSKDQALLVRFLNRLSTIRILGRDTDLTFNVKGRKWVNCDGHENFPDGEVFTSPVENSARGHIRYTFPAVYGGREVEDVRLTFRRGRVVDAKAEKGDDYLDAMLKSDKGASYVGEVAFGTNYGIRRFTRNTLFDEKIGGTFHAAVGAAYPESGGTNKSGLHWDMVCDLRNGGVVRVDGEVIAKNGRFADARWPK